MVPIKRNLSSLGLSMVLFYCLQWYDIINFFTAALFDKSMIYIYYDIDIYILYMFRIIYHTILYHTILYYTILWYLYQFSYTAIIFSSNFFRLYFSDIKIHTHTTTSNSIIEYSKLFQPTYTYIENQFDVLHFQWL